MKEVKAVNMTKKHVNPWHNRQPFDVVFVSAKT